MYCRWRLPVFRATGVMDVLMLPEIGTTFGFGDDLKTLRRWLDDAGICWALDGSHKEEFDLPPDDSHTFHDGLHRLFLAYALPDRKRVAGRWPLAGGTCFGFPFARSGPAVAVCRSRPATET